MIPLSEGDLSLLTALSSKISALHSDLGALRYHYKSEEQTLLKALEAQESLKRVHLRVLAEKYLRDAPGNWSWSSEDKAFIKSE